MNSEKHCLPSGGFLLTAPVWGLKSSRVGAGQAATIKRQKVARMQVSGPVQDLDLSLSAGPRCDGAVSSLLPDILFDFWVHFQLQTLLPSTS